MGIFQRRTAVSSLFALRLVVQGCIFTTNKMILRIINFPLVVNWLGSQTAPLVNLTMESLDSDNSKNCEEKHHENQRITKFRQTL